MKTTIITTLLALLIASQAKASCVSEMIYHEARGESFIGQVAVANVATGFFMRGAGCHG